MEFTCHTAYNLKALTAAARALRRTLRAKKSRVSKLYAWIISGLLVSRKPRDSRVVPKSLSGEKDKKTPNV